MKLFTQLHEHYIDKNPIVLTVGFFDGLHLGHQHLFQKLNAIKGSAGYSYALTFSNHPMSIIKPDTFFPLITTHHHKLKLLESQNLDALFTLPFTRELKDSTADEFIAQLYESISFTDLLIGPDSTIGKNKEGNYDLLKLLSKKYSFKLHRFEVPIKSNPHFISSSLIRKKIEEGNLPLVEKLLGRPYSLLLKTVSGDKKGTELGFPTLNFELENLVSLPCGVYKVYVKTDAGLKLAVANLGFAPTLKERDTPLLEVHVLEKPFYSDLTEFEIIFSKFIRPEKKFSSVDELKAQISADIKSAKSI